MKRIQVASKGKRVLSSLIDLLIIGGLFALSYFFIFYKAVAAAQNFSYHNQIILSERRHTHLYSDDGTTTLLVANPNMSHSDINSAVENYYTEYLYNKVDISKRDVTYTKYWYGVTILHLKDVRGTVKPETTYDEDKILYEWEDDGIISDKFKTKSSSSDIDLLDFQKGNFGTAVYNLSLSDLTPIKNSSRVISYGNIRALMYSSMFSTFIPCFVIPISLKNGKTIGKLITGLVVLTDEGYEYKRYKHIFRYLSFYIVEVFGGVLTIGLTFILSTCLVLFSKKRRALHDYISFSVVADEKHSVFYKDENEEKEYKNIFISELPLK